jgi:hypothetical protein
MVTLSRDNWFQKWDPFVSFCSRRVAFRILRGNSRRYRTRVLAMWRPSEGWASGSVLAGYFPPPKAGHSSSPSLCSFSDAIRSFLVVPVCLLETYRHISGVGRCFLPPFRRGSYPGSGLAPHTSGMPLVLCLLTWWGDEFNWHRSRHEDGRGPSFFVKAWNSDQLVNYKLSKKVILPLVLSWRHTYIYIYIYIVTCMCDYWCGLGW